MCALLHARRLPTFLCPRELRSVDSVVHSMKILLLIAKCQSLSNKLDMLIYCTLQMHVQQATYANELHVNVQHLSFHKKKEKKSEHK